MEYRIIRKDELYHYGVPGMKWGHRKGPTSLAGTGHRALAGVYGMNQRFYSKTGNKTLASMNASARNQQLKKAAAADAAKSHKAKATRGANVAKAKAARKARVKKAAVVGGTVAVAALAVYGGHKYKNLKNEMNTMNSRIKLGQALVDNLYKDNASFTNKHNPALSSSVSYLGNDFKFHTATKTANSYENLSVGTQRTFNTVRDYARAKKRYTGRY